MRKVGRPWKDDDPDIRPNRVLYMRDDIVAICDRYLVSRAPQLSSLRVKEEGASGQSYTGSAEGPAVCASETDSDSDSELSSSGDSHDYWSDDTGSHNSTSSDYSGFSSFDDGWSDDTIFHGTYDHSGYEPRLDLTKGPVSWGGPTSSDEFSDSCSTSVGDSGYISASSADSYSDSDVELYNTEELPRIDMREIAVANESASPWMPESEPFDISGESAFGSMFDDDTPDAFATAERRPGLTWPTKPRGSAGLPPAGSDAPASAHGADVVAASPSK